MNSQQKLSNVTKDYLTSFYCILDEMIEGMTGAELTNSISHNFIAQMIPHHRAAIEMSRNILKYTTNIQLQDIALKIISEQTKSIENMRKIEFCCAQHENSKQELCLYQRRVNQIMQIMFSEMRNSCFTNRVNCNFMWEMIPHHMGAVRMSENALQFDICPELKPILNAIITSQKRGIMQMTQLLKCIGC
jgi:uncharacterized protein (DUF305 family)